MTGRIVVATEGEWPETDASRRQLPWTWTTASHVEVCRLGQRSSQTTPAWLVDRVRETGAQAVVVPARGSLRGTITAHALRAVVAEGLCPVLVARPLHEPCRVLVAAPLDDLRIPLVEVPPGTPAVAIRSFTSTDDYLLTLGRPPELERWRRREAERPRSLQETRFARLLRLLGLQGEVVVAAGRSGRDARDEASRVGARLIVVGVSPRRSFLAGLTESPEETLALDFFGPVLVVPARRPGGPAAP